MSARSEDIRITAGSDDAEARLRPAEAVFDAQGRVRCDIPCINCGYNLRTLVFAGLCPECSHPVSQSTNSELLRCRPPGLARRLGWGVVLLLCLAPVWLVLAALVHYWIGTGPTAPSPDRPALKALVTADTISALLLLAGLGLVAATLMPKAYASVLLPNRAARWPTVVRFALLGAFVLTFVYALGIAAATQVWKHTEALVTELVILLAAANLLRNIALRYIVPFALLGAIIDWLRLTPARSRMRNVDQCSMIPLTLAAVSVMETCLNIAFDVIGYPQETSVSAAHSALSSPLPLTNIMGFLLALPVYACLAMVAVTFFRSARVARSIAASLNATGGRGGAGA